MRVRIASVLAVASCLAAGLTLTACGSSASGPTVALVAVSASVRAAVANAVTVSPLPGTPDASPATQISFLGPAGTTVTGVRASGSRSGAHVGVLRAYSTGTGESFLPSRAFAQGETVTVTARVRSGPMAGRHLHSTFTVAVQAPISQVQFPLAPGDPNAVQHYVSAPSLTPSLVHVTTPAAPSATPGYLLLAPYQGLGTPGPMIADQSGSLVWFHPLPTNMAATNLSVGSYAGQPVLEWWQGRILGLGFGQGEDVIYDSSYREVASVRAGNGYMADLHVTRLTPAGTAFLDAYDPVRMNLSAAGGDAAGVLSDSVIQEIDVRTGLVMWEWHALGHIPFGDSKNPAPKTSYPWDFVHVNSVDPGSSGDLLVSFRNTWSLDDVDLHSGGFRWRIGGVHSTFRLGPDVKFYWQHDASFQPGNRISLFDNGSNPPEEKQSRGLLLDVDHHAHTVRLEEQFANPSRTLLASSQGSTLALPGGNWLLGYGGLPDFTEFDSSGRVLLDGRLGRGVQNFRTSLASWSGQPPGSPSAVLIAGVPPSVAVSWNGATAVSSWRLLAGASPTSLAPVATVPRAGFQTTISLPAGGAYAAVQALDAAGTVLGVSATLVG
jgi:hypothetical protein